jgi:predicted nicotinamide N-methyase
MTPDRRRAFILENTALMPPPHVPEIRLHLADEAHALWQKTEDELSEIGLPPPFWAFAWAGGQGLARYVLDRPESVRGKSVLDFASGCGLVAVAAAMSGASSVVAADIDAFCKSAIDLNAAANHVAVETVVEDLIGTDAGWQVLLAGDIFYHKDIVDRLMPWFATLTERGCEILVGDPGRTYLPKEKLQPLATYAVPVTRDLEDAEVKHTTVWRFP